MQGSQYWLPAARMPGLAFSVKRTPMPVWLKRNAIALAAIVSAVLMLLVAPAWYVLALNAHRNAKIYEQKKELLDLGIRSISTDGDWWWHPTAYTRLSENGETLDAARLRVTETNDFELTFFRDRLTSRAAGFREGAQLEQQLEQPQVRRSS